MLIEVEAIFKICFDGVMSRSACSNLFEFLFAVGVQAYIALCHILSKLQRNPLEAIDKTGLFVATFSRESFLLDYDL